MVINGEKIPDTSPNTAEAPDTIIVSRTDENGNKIEYQYHKKPPAPDYPFFDPYGHYRYNPDDPYHHNTLKKSWESLELKKRKWNILIKFLITGGLCLFLFSFSSFKIDWFFSTIAIILAALFAIIPFPILLHQIKILQWERRQRRYYRGGLWF